MSDSVCLCVRVCACVCTVDAGTVQALWLSWDFPTTTPAGNYTGHLDLSDGDVHTVTIPVTFTVAGSPLPDHGDFHSPFAR